MKVSTMVTYLSTKIVTNFVFGQRGLSSKAFSIGAECEDGGQRCMFFVWFPKDAAWNQPLDAHNWNEKEVYPAVTYVPSFRSLFLFTKSTDDQLVANQGCYDKRSTMVHGFQTTGFTVVSRQLVYRPLNIITASTTTHESIFRLTSSMNGSKDRFCASSFRRFGPHLTNG